MRTVGLFLVLVLLAACDAPTPVVTTTPSDGPAALVVPYTCGQIPFDPALLDQRGGAENGADPVAVALRAHLDLGGPDIEMLPRTGWIVVGATPVLVELVARDSVGDWAYVSVDQAGGQWAVNGWGGCRPTAFVEGRSLATWTLDPDAAPPGPAARTFDALVNERACTGGQPMGDRLQPPVIAYGSAEVTVIFTALPLPGGHDCPGNPSSRVTVQLAEPLGERALLDGAFFPPADPGLLEQ